MTLKINHRKPVQLERMLGREASDAIRECPIAYLPVGCLERHGDHLPMGLDVIKAHKMCCLAARAIGGVVYPPHFYSGIHTSMPGDMKTRLTADWANLYTDETARNHLSEIIRQLAQTGIKVLVLYSGHYPPEQVEMIEEIATELSSELSIAIIPFAERMVLDGDHAGVSETSLMLYLDKSLVDMTRIGDINYQEHFWNETNTPENASVSRGEEEATRVIEALKAKIEAQTT